MAVIAVLLTLAAASWCWPPSAAPAAPGWRKGVATLLSGRVGRTALVTVMPVVLAMTMSLLVAAATSCATVTARALWIRRRRTVTHRRHVQDVRRWVDRAARELLAGAAPSEALAPLGGLLESSEMPPGSPAALIPAVQQLAARRGIPLSTVLGAVSRHARDLEQAAEDRNAQVAGPLLSGYVLAALPLLGVALGSAMRLEPLRVLTTTRIGGLLLVAGTALNCAGLWWCHTLAHPRERE